MTDTTLIDNLVDHTDDCVLVIDMEGKILTANSSMVDLIELAVSAMVGQPAGQLLGVKTTNQPVLELIEKSLNQGVEHHLVETVFTSANGECFNARLSTSLITSEQEIGRLVMKDSLVVFIKTVTECQEGESATGKKPVAVLQQRVNELEARQAKYQNIFNKLELIKYISVAVIFIVFVFLIIGAQNSVKSYPYRGSEAPDAPRRPRFVKAKRDTLAKQILLAGRLEPHSQVTIAAQTKGKVILRNFTDGDYVQKDQILYQMDTKDLAKSVRSARITFIELEEQYNQLASWDSSLSVMQARRKYELTKIRLQNERKKLQETKKLYEKGIIPRVEYEQAVTAYKKAEFDFEDAQQSLNTELDKGNPEKLRVLQLKLSNAREELQEIEARYEATLIRSPVSGIIMPPRTSDGREKSFKNEGDMVNDGDLVATIGATDSFIIRSFVGETNVKHLSPGMPVTVSGPSFRAFSLQGELDWIAGRARTEGRFHYYPIRIVLSSVPDSLRRRLRIGMNVEASITLQHFADVTTVPVEAVDLSREQPMIFVRNAAGEIEKRPASVRYSSFDRIIVTSIEPGDSVLVNPKEMP